MVPPATSKPPLALALTVPVVTAPLPQMTVAVNSPAVAPGAVRCHEAAPSNRALDWRDGDAAAVEAAFATAAHVERVRLADTRLAPVSMEPRAGIGAWDEATHAALGGDPAIPIPVSEAPQRGHSGH